MANFDPTFSDISPANAAAPTISNWFTSETQGAPDTIAPYLAAHGFKPKLSVPYYVDGEFAGWLVNMNRTKFEHGEAIQDMINRMTTAYNEGREHNDKRYEDLISNLDTLLGQHQTEIQAFLDDSMNDATDGYITLLLSSLDLLVTDHTSLVSDLNSYDPGDRDAELTSLKSLWATAATDLDTEYDNTTGDLSLSTIISEVDDAIDDLDTAVTDFNTAFDGLRTTLASDFTTHQTLTRGYLIGLGTTELARINEEAAADLAKQTQDLIDRGLYSSALITDITTRNTREKSERITKLNDELNRQKVVNEHQLCEEQYRMRLGGLDVAMKAVDGAAKVVAARLQHGEWSAEIRHKLMGLTIQTKLSLLSVREKYYQFLLASIDWETSRRFQIYDRLFQVRMDQLKVRQSVGQFHSEIIRYQLDTRNNLALAMFKTVEAREDVYPGLGDMAALVTSLGDDS